MLLKKLYQMDSFSGSERTIAAFILEHKEKILHMTIHEIAVATYTSYPTIVRLCRKLGLAGFRQFKIALASELERHYEELHPVDLNVPFHKKESPKEIARRISELSHETISRCQDTLTNESLEYASAIVAAAKQTYLIANGDSMIRAMSFQNKMLKINHMVQVASFLQEQSYHVYNATEQDCVIFVTYNAARQEYKKLAALLKRKGVKQIVITANESGELAKLCNVVLPLPVKEDKAAKIATFASQIAIEYTLNVLYSCVFEVEYDKNYLYKKTGYESLKNLSLHEF